MSKDTIHLFNNVSVKGIIANGSIGTTGQTLASNGTVAYWSDITGYTGSVGFTGSRGTDGYAGSVGFTGSRGTDGYAGSVGFTGSQGPIGFTGSWGGTAQANVNMNGYSINSANTINVNDIVATGNLTISGTTTYINTTNLNIGDNILTLNADLPGATAPTENSGIEVNRGSSANVQFIWDETSDRWTTNGQSLAISSLIASGSASGITTLAAGNTTITGFANVSVSVNSAAFTVGSTVVANSTGTYATFLNGKTESNLNVNTATFSNTITVADTRNTVTTPETTTAPQVRFDFKVNTTDGLSDGGLYFGEMTFRPYGTTTDWSGGPAHQLGFTSNGNIHHRSGTSTTWGSWRRLYEENTVLAAANTTITGFANVSTTLQVTGIATFNDDIYLGTNARYIYAKMSNGTTNNRLLGINSANVVYIGAIDNAVSSTIINAGGGASPLHIYANNITSASFVANGNVGFGTTTPNYRLHIEHNSDTITGIFTRNSNTGTSAAAAVLASSALGSIYMRAHSAAHSAWPNSTLLVSESGFTGGLNILQGGANPVRLWTDSLERMRIAANGNVGIGNTAPASKLVVAGNVEISTGGLNSVNGAIVISNTGSSSATITISTANTSANGGVGTEYIRSRVHSNQDLAFVTDARLYFQSAGANWSRGVTYTTTSPFTTVSGTGQHFGISTVDARSNATSSGVFSDLDVSHTANTATGASATLQYSVITSSTTESSWSGTANNAMLYSGYNAGTLRYRVNRNGDIWTNGSITVTSTLATGNTTITGDLSVTGNTTLGDASADSVTINANTITIAANSNIDAGTLYIDSLNNRVGIGTTAPQNLLHLESASPVIRFRDTDSAAGTYSTISSDNTTGSFLISADSANTAASSTISFLTDGAERVRFTGTGSALFLGSASQTLDIGTTTGVSYLQSYGASFANTPLALYTGTSERMRIAADGNVGIGNSSPARKLTVQGDSAGTLTVAAFYNADLTNNNGSVFSFRTDTSGAGAQSFWEYAGVSGVVDEHNNATRAGSLNFFTGNSTGLANRLTIVSNGHVGIGTSTPVGRLDTVGIAYLGSDTNNSLFVNSNTTVTRVFAAGRSSFSNSALSIGTSNTTSTVEAIRIDTLGNIGIGSTNPAVKVVISNAGAEGYEINPTGGVGGGATVSAYNRSTSAYTTLTTYASAMTWYANGTTRAIDLVSNGNLGIANTTPAHKLAIAGDLYVAGAGSSAYYNTINNSGLTSVSPNGAQIALRLIQTGIADWSIYNEATTGNLRVGTVAQFSTNGNIGIGTATPAAKLHLFDSNAPETRLQIGNTLSEGAYTFYSGSTKEAAIGFIPNSAFLNISSGRSAGWGGTITFTTDTSERMRIAANGNVGIGNTAPVNRLFVTGDIGLDGISVRDTATATTTAVTQITLFEYPIATYDSCDVIIKAVRSGERHTTKVLVTANSTVAIATEYGTLTTGSSLYTVDADISGANTRIRITPSSTTSTVFKASYELITT